MSKRPTCCPDPECLLHTKDAKPPEWYSLDGTYETKTFGTVQRYRCTYCGKRFSEQTFAVDYYVILRQLVTTGSTRAAAAIPVLLNQGADPEKPCVLPGMSTTAWSGHDLCALSQLLQGLSQG